MKTDCPKCGSPSARYMKTETDLILKCLCGLHKVVFSTLTGIEIQHNDTGKDIRLPRVGTRLRRTLSVVLVLEEATTELILERLHEIGEIYDSSDVASYLTILRSKGLVYTTTVRKGIAGGSTWRLTEEAIKIL